MTYKHEFIHDLSQVLSKYCKDDGLVKLEYFKPGNHFHEEVVITYDGGFQEIINVSYDSCIAMLKDICKQGFSVV
jgi:hypothetical protein